MADLEHRTNQVASSQAGGGGLRGLIRVSLHRSWSFRLDSSSPTA
jgi:hypothetical protein